MNLEWRETEKKCDPFIFLTSWFGLAATDFLSLDKNY